MTTASETVLTSVNPADGQAIGQWPVADAQAVTAAVAAARAASEFWQSVGFKGRRRALLRWNAYLVNHADELAELIHRENGKPVEDAQLEIALTAEHIAWPAKHAEKVLAPQRISPGLTMANCQAVIEQKPLGVVGVIGPWNYPVYTPNGSIAYALAAGNTVVYKPSEYSTSIGHYYVDAFTNANPELPHGILMAISGGGETGAALVAAEVDKIAFTGSAATGKRIMAAAAERLTPVLLECGGKDPVIVAADADIEAAAEATAWSAMANGGQTCAGAERAYVVAEVYDAFVEALKNELATVKSGTAYGPMTMPSQLEVVKRHIDDALERGGRAIVGGPDSVHPPFVDPVVLVDVPEDADAVREETFGPTLTVCKARDIDQAVELANNSEYGLASAVFSKNHGMDIARRLRTGATAVNSVLTFAAIPGLPFGGSGRSGLGRIHGAYGLREFVYPHAIARQRFPVPGMALLSFRRTPTATALTRTVTKLRFGRAK